MPGRKVAAREIVDAHQIKPAALGKSTGVAVKQDDLNSCF